MKYLIKVWNFWVHFGFLLLVNFALGGICFFLLSLARLFPAESRNPDEAYTFVLLNNSFEAMVATVVLHIFLVFLQKRIQPKWVHYLVLLFATYFFEQVIWAILEGKYSVSFIISDLLNFHPFNLIFRSNILIALGLLYHLLTKEQTQTHKITEQEYQLLLLNELKTKAELEALQAKISPHFLYNSLNSIAGLVHIDADKAEKMVLLLAKFFRYSTHIKHHYLNTLAGELEMVQTYLEVEKVRFEDRLTYEISLANEDLKNYLIPSFLLQPLVENAIKHGISKITEKGLIQIKVWEEANLLQICMHDNGFPFPDNIHSGYGLQSTQDKLRLLGGENASMEIKNEPKKYILIRLNLEKIINE